MKGHQWQYTGRRLKKIRPIIAACCLWREFSTMLVIPILLHLIWKKAPVNINKNKWFLFSEGVIKIAFNRCCTYIQLPWTWQREQGRRTWSTWWAHTREPLPRWRTHRPLPRNVSWGIAVREDRHYYWNQEHTGHCQGRAPRVNLLNKTDITTETKNTQVNVREEFQG